MKDNKIIANLNNNQIEAVNRLEGATLVIAGAGSGKTAVLTRRVANLITNGQKPGSILCLTFTNKAAGEMNSRLNDLLLSVNIKIPILRIWQFDYTLAPLLCTFHSLGVRLLREFSEKAGLKNEFTIIDEDDRKKIIKELLKLNDLDIKKVPVQLVGYFFSLCKQELILPSQSRGHFDNYPEYFHRLYSQYTSKLQQNSSVDFDDLIFKTYFLLNDNQDVRTELQERWQHIMVDEYQDTNLAQFKLIQLLSPKENIEKNLNCSVFVVGDDAQSIYGFRGSKIELILDFDKYYPTCKRITLNQNYRSTQPILDIAQKVIGLNQNQFKKELFTTNTNDLEVKYYQARTEYDEATYIIKKLVELYQTNEQLFLQNKTDNSLEIQNLDLDSTPNVSVFIDRKIDKPVDPISALFDNIFESIQTTNLQYKSLEKNNYDYYNPKTYSWDHVKKLDEVAILYRTHSQSRAIEEAFIKNNVPYKLVSGVKFLERKEIKDVLSILKFINNGADKLSLARFLPLILDGVGRKTTEKIIEYLDDPSLVIAPKYQYMVMELMVKLQTALTETNSLIGFVQEIIVRSGYMRYLQNEYPIAEDFQARVDNIGELYSLMLAFDEDESLEVKDRLKNFLEHVMLLSSMDKDDTDNLPKVSLMSLHQSKGLEYETIFLVGIDDGLLPHSRSLIDPKEMEEEIRLAYVGITRAKENLFLISANSRTTFGKVEFYNVSRIFKQFLSTHAKRDL
jgi:DNA helicase II / ATP-dependent DNA helicase PcrA